MRQLIDDKTLKRPPADTSPARLNADHVIGPAVAQRKYWPVVDAVMCAHDAILRHYGWVERVTGSASERKPGNAGEPKTLEMAEEVPAIKPALLDNLEQVAVYLADLVDPYISQLRQLVDAEEQRRQRGLNNAEGDPIGPERQELEA